MESKPKIIDEIIRHHIGWEYEVPLSLIKEDIEELEKLGVTHLNIEIETHYEDSEIVITPLKQREETELEMKARIEKEQNEVSVEKQRAIEQIEALKQKFNIY